MIFKPGNTVKFIHTGEIGEILEIMDSETVLVLLDGDEIPADIENIVIWKNEAPFTPLTKGSKLTTKPTTTQPKKIKNPEKAGLFVAFEPNFDNEGNINRFDVFIVNDSSYKFIYTYKIKIINNFSPEKNEMVEPFVAKKIGELSQYDLSDNPTLYFDLWQITTEGTGEKAEKTVKIKPKQFFSKTKNISFTTVPVYAYELATKLIGKAKEEDLKTYTKRNLQEAETEEFYDYVKVHKIAKIEDRASFQDEIDLHIEMLTANHKTLQPAEMLQLQLQVFEEYLDQAIRLGLPKVHIIHGLGKGRLRSEIKRKLDRNPYVRMHANLHHPKYGFGATEVYLD